MTWHIRPTDNFVSRRFTTTVPPQGLYFMNSPFVERKAKRLVHRLAEHEPPEEPIKAGEPEDLSWKS